MAYRTRSRASTSRRNSSRTRRAAAPVRRARTRSGGTAARRSGGGTQTLRIVLEAPRPDGRQLPANIGVVPLIPGQPVPGGRSKF